MYNKIVKNIKVKLFFLKITFLLLIISAVGAAIPFRITVGSISLIQKGVPVWIVALFIVVLLFVYLIIYAIVIMPVENALLLEVDPHKYLALKTGLESPFTSQSDGYLTRMTALFFMGDFKSVIMYADKLIDNRKNNLSVDVLFRKASAQFFLNDFSGMTRTIMEFDNVVNCVKMSAKRESICEKYRAFLNLMTAISYNDKNNVEFFVKEVKPWNNGDIIALQCDYLIGIAAVVLGDRRNAIYKLMLVKEKGEKTFFSDFAEYFLKKVD